MKNRLSNTLRYSYTAPARTEELRVIREAVEREALCFGFDPETAYRVALAVDEACANIVEHAFRCVADESFSVEIMTEANRFVIKLFDSGKPFQPASLPELDLKKRAVEHQQGGLGLHIINLVMDIVDYVNTSERPNCLRLVKFLNGSSGKELKRDTL